MIEQSRTLLRRCRELGVSAVFSELQENHAEQVSNNFSTVLNNLCSEVVDALRSGNRDSQELLATAIEDIAEVSALEGLQDFLVLLADWLREKDIEHFARRIEALRQDYKDTYRRMIALVAFTERSNDDNEKAPGRVLNEFVSPEWAKRRQLLREYPDVLLSKRIELVFDALLEVNSDGNTIHLLDKLRTLLRRCRTWDIDPAWYLGFAHRWNSATRSRETVETRGMRDKII